MNILSINEISERDIKKKLKHKSGDPITQAVDQLTTVIEEANTGIDKSSNRQARYDTRPIENCRILFRRAIILRSILEREAKEILDDKKKARIDEDIIKAFLWIDKYEHGIRSVEAIVKMARPDKGWLRIASLPSGEQLGMHVDDNLFLKLARGQQVLPKCSLPSETESALNSSLPASG